MTLDIALHVVGVRTVSVRMLRRNQTFLPMVRTLSMQELRYITNDDVAVVLQGKKNCKNEVVTPWCFNHPAAIQGKATIDLSKGKRYKVASKTLKRG